MLKLHLRLTLTSLVTLLIVSFGTVDVSLTAQTNADDDFVPVTDAMLENPAPGDWLMWRRTQDGWGYSPLDQVNRDNVHELQMVWTRALSAGSQEGTPIAYGGMLSLPEPERCHAGDRCGDGGSQVGVPPGAT